MHNAALAQLGVPWRYLAFEVPPDQLAAALAGAGAMRFIGVNLTVPHKLLAVPMMDLLDPSALRWGAVNTVRFEARDPAGLWQPLAQFDDPPDGPVRACGFNTDADAIIRSLREDLALEPRGADILLLGAGGAGRTAALRLAAEGARTLYLVNRTPGKIVALAAELRERFPDTRVEAGFPSGSVDLLLNATSLGLAAGDPLPMDPAAFDLRRAKAVYDMIYRPAQTPLLKAARAACCRTSNGLGMLLYQGAAALEIWTGRPAPVAVMRQTLELNIYGASTPAPSPAP